MPDRAYTYTLPLIVAGAITLAPAGYAARRRQARGALPFIGICLATAVWAITYALDVSSAAEPVKLIWSKLGYVGIVSGPVFWPAFAL